jgi:hypothetical protein
MAERRCPYCERTFQPSKYQPRHAVCKEAACRQRRLADDHRRRIAADPEYRQVCLDSSQKWRSRNPDFWQRYREQHPSGSSEIVSSKCATKSGVCDSLQTTTKEDSRQGRALPRWSGVQQISGPGKGVSMTRSSRNKESLPQILVLEIVTKGTIHSPTLRCVLFLLMKMSPIHQDYRN